MQTEGTFFEKVWNSHVIADLGDRTSLLQVDRLFLHELSGSAALKALEDEGRRVAAPDQVFSVIDHAISVRPGRGPDDSERVGGIEAIRTSRNLSRALNLTLFDVGDPRQGIVHVISPELGVALPGLTLVCGDSHTCTVGGIGALAWGIGSTEAKHVLATQTLPQRRPDTMRIRFEGSIPLGVYPKDLILHLIGTIGANGGIGYAVEFAGSAIRSMPIEGRLTICNMAIEFSAKYGFVPPDDVTYAYLAGREFAPSGADWDRALAYWRMLATDDGAGFDKEVVIDCTEIRPQVTWGTSPQQVAAIDGRVPDPSAIEDSGMRELTENALRYIGLAPGTRLEGIPLQAADIGSCTNARLSDLREAAAVLKGRKVPVGFPAYCTPGSGQVKAQAEAEGIDRIFRDAGFEWQESGCAYCGGGGADRLAGKRVISTTNRNFEGRQGPKTATHLASPATVAASALSGCIADPRKLLVH
jgi:3-isopropylmalate/(R)-2-methylmalate dehydratase large subunit